MYQDFNEEFYDQIGFKYSTGSDQKGGIIKRQNAQPISLEPGFSVNADIALYAHAGVGQEWPTALSYASANLRSVTIDFLPPPVATFSYLPTKPILGDAITFDASESVCPEGMTCEYFWTFNGEDGDTGKTINKAFHDVGKYKVGLTVIDTTYGQEDYYEKELTFAPAPFAFPYTCAFTTVVIDGSPRPTSGSLFLKLSNNSIATADLKISNVSLVGDESGIFAIDYDTCTGESIAPGAFSSGAIIIRLNNVEEEGVAALAIDYNSLTGDPFYIPIMHKIYSVSTPEKYGEIESICQNLKEILISGFLDPLIVGFPDTILDYEDILGKEFYFKGKEDITPDIQKVHFSDTLLDKIINAETTIKALPYTITPFSPTCQMTLEAPQSTETEELFLIDFLQITGDSRWFTFIDTIDYDIGGIAVEAFKFIFFQSDGNTANGYSIVYGKDTNQILELTRLFGSTDIMDMTLFKSDYDIDMDADGKNLSDFANKYLAFDLMADLNSDGIVDIRDLTLFAAEFGK
ncbi:MAG: PKD domain-containing protein [Desulfobacula sp.]